MCLRNGEELQLKITSQQSQTFNVTPDEESIKSLFLRSDDVRYFFVECNDEGSTADRKLERKRFRYQLKIPTRVEEDREVVFPFPSNI